MLKKLILTMGILCISQRMSFSDLKTYIIENKEFSEENLIIYINKLNIKYPKVVLAQAKLESGNFTSNIFKENNNMFGMKLPERRKTTAIGTNRGHATYEDWIKSLQDYKLWQDDMIHKADTRKKYLEYLGRNYAADPNYINKIYEKL